MLFARGDQRSLGASIPPLRLPPCRRYSMRSPAGAGKSSRHVIMLVRNDGDAAAPLAWDRQVGVDNEDADERRVLGVVEAMELRREPADVVFDDAGRRRLAPVVQDDQARELTAAANSVLRGLSEVLRGLLVGSAVSEASPRKVSTNTGLNRSGAALAVSTT